MRGQLHSVGPEDVDDDEQRIGGSYKPDWWTALAMGAVILATAYWADVKWVVAVGVIEVVWAILLLDGRLHDISVRQRRTNILLSESEQDWPTSH